MGCKESNQASKQNKDQRVASMQLFVLYLSLGLIRVFEIKISHMCINNTNQDLVCEKKISLLNGKSINVSTVHSWRVVGGVGGGVYCILS